MKVRYVYLYDPYLPSSQRDGRWDAVHVEPRINSVHVIDVLRTPARSVPDGPLLNGVSLNVRFSTLRIIHVISSQSYLLRQHAYYMRTSQNAARDFRGLQFIQYLVLNYV